MSYKCEGCDGSQDEAGKCESCGTDMKCEGCQGTSCACSSSESSAEESD